MICINLVSTVSSVLLGLLDLLPEIFDMFTESRVKGKGKGSSDLTLRLTK